MTQFIDSVLIVWAAIIQTCSEYRWAVTFSNSKRMAGVFDIQRDHAVLIDDCMALLAPGGLLVFSTNAQRFRLDPALPQRYAVRDISRDTLPADYLRNGNIHACFEIREPIAAGPRSSSTPR
jgi:hypothetical protein